MPTIPAHQLVQLQQHAEGIRNICILAHVDHGKTSLTDALIATNGIISPKLAGKIRYLDSRPDEQLRGITMRDFLINLIDSPGHIDFSYEVSTASRLCDGAIVLVDAVEGVCSQTVTVLRQTWIEKLKPLLVINKMDRLITEWKMSPADAHTHLTKLVEQVNAVMGSFYQGERMEDDLRWREKMEEKLNAAAADKTATDKTTTSVAEHADSIDTTSTPAEYEEKDDEDIYFAPEKNNVIFASAIDGWAFTVKQFAGLYERKLGIKRSVLEKVLWGDYFLDPKTKRVLSSKHLKGRHLKPMFVQLVLENIWAIYDATTGGNNGKGDPAMVDKITKSLNITLPPHVLRSRDPRAILTALFAAWLPLSTALLVSVTEYLPSPAKAQAERMPEIIDTSVGADHVAPEVRKAIVDFDTSKDAPVVAYVSKMFSVPESELPQHKRRNGALTAEEARDLGRKKRAELARQQAVTNGESSDVGSITDALGAAAIGEGATEEPAPTEDKAEHLIGFARIYSGTLSVGDEVYVLGPKFSPANPHAEPVPKKVKITALYLMMGRGLESLTSVPAGVVFGIGGLEGHMLKSGTLCSQLPGSLNLAGVTMGSEPIVRVALEPENPYDLDKMINGLKLLVQSDPCAEYEQLPSGEHVVLTAGELHLERCLKDLEERFAKCKIQAGEPIVPYRESIVAAAEMNPPKNPDLGRGVVVSATASKQVSVRLQVRPLPPSVTEFLSKNSGSVKRLNSERKAQETQHSDEQVAAEIAGAEQDGMQEAEQREVGQTLSPAEFKKQLKAAFAVGKKEREIWMDGVIDKITAFGPRNRGPNILVDMTSAGICGKAYVSLSMITPQDDPANTPSLVDTADDADTSDRASTARSFASTIIYAFQLATAQGPCCAEPVQGLAVFLQAVTLDDTAETDHHRLTGEVIKAVRSGIHTGFLDWSPRMLLAMYSCEIQASTDVLGRVYAVLTRRRGTILSETMSTSSAASTTGSQTFTISALLPVAESFGFSDEIRKRSSGSASPQLRFAGFDMLDEDPFWVPFTEDQLEDLGELADRENVAKRYVDRVRRRKGLLVKEVKVEAEKQKTLKR
ncbi:elongation factor Tu GTP binding domain-containing protein [Lizonia empirigonia]|nr:elongation factor Tu GTP binding domain-containing protein [Lizonia empirigonia]